MTKLEFQGHRRWRSARKVDVDARETGAVLTEPDGGVAHYLNVTASVVYLMCDGTHSEDDIAAFLKANFRLDTLPLDDVLAALQQLESQGLIAPV